MGVYQVPVTWHVIMTKRAFIDRLALYDRCPLLLELWHFLRTNKDQQQ